MVHLTSTVGSFHAKVLAARLGSEGVLVNLRGAVDGPYPIFASVEVYVRQDQAAIAREILLADAVDAAFSDFDGDLREGPGAEPWELDPRPRGSAGRDSRQRTLVALTVAFLVVFVIVGYLAAAHSF
jgi:hypothetical protein